MNAQAAANEFALLQAALKAKVAPKGTEEMLAPAEALGPRDGHGSVREYARNSLHLSLEPASAASLRSASSGGGSDEEEEEDAPAAAGKSAAASKAAAAAAAAKRRAAAAAAVPRKAKRDPRFPSVFLLRKLHLPDEDPKLVLKKLKSKKAAGGDAGADAAAPSGKLPGAAKLTWEVINDVGVSSYDARKNPIYAPAFKVMREGQDTMASATATDEDEADEEAAMPAKAAAKSKKGVAVTPSKVTPQIRRRRQQQEEDGGEEGEASAV